MASGGVTFVTPPRVTDQSPTYVMDNTYQLPKISNKTNNRSKDNQKLKTLNELSTDWPNKRSFTVSFSKTNDSAIGRKRSDTNNYRKRRHSFGANTDIKFANKRRKERIILPTKFLLGGNIQDPLNLSSLANGANQVTPQSSPLPTPKHKTQVEVLIPANINDPLNLNSSGDIDESDLISPKVKSKPRKRKRKRTDSETTVGEPALDLGDSSKITESICEPKTKCEITPKPKVRINDNIKLVDKIVSPVIPQGLGSKHRRFADNTSKPVLNLESFVDKSEAKVNEKKQKNKTKSKDPHFRAKDEGFRYGNYNRYYGYRNCNQFDSRLECFKSDWFRNKDVLDIGCNAGHITLAIAKNFEPKKIIGLDIDNSLIRIANKNIRHYITSSVLRTQDFPISLPLFHGPLASTATHDSDDTCFFPKNVCFITGNYVSESDELSIGKQQFDTILCLSLTKWIHLNWGDNGIKCLFKRMFTQLRPNGRLILEAQPFCSYKKKKKINETTLSNFNAIKFRPEQFNEYLLSREVGFSQSEMIGTPENPSKGFRRPIYLFTKSGVSFEKE